MLGFVGGIGRDEIKRLYMYRQFASSTFQRFANGRKDSYSRKCCFRNLFRIYCWRAIARQHTILYNRAKSAKFVDVRSETCAVDSVFDIRGSCDPGLFVLSGTPVKCASSDRVHVKI